MAEVAAKRRRLDSNNDTGAEATQVTPVTLGEPAEFAERLFKLVTVDGDVFPRFPVRKAPEEHIRSIRTMAMREEDIIVAAFPKAGTHWVWEMVQMLVAGKAEHDSRSKENAMIEFSETADMDFIPSPRVLNSHLFLRQLSNEIVEKRSRVVHVIRNPKDVVVSFYFHMRQLRMFQDNGFEDFALKFLDSTDFQGTCLDYFTYMHEMMRWQTEHPEVPLINIYYEDVKKSPVQSVQTLARFLQLGHATDALCSDIADACAFNNMQEAEISIKNPDRPGRVLFTDLKPRLYRKGEVGDWKNYFTMALSEQYDEVIEEKLKDYNLRFQYSI